MRRVPRSVGGEDPVPRPRGKVDSCTECGADNCGGVGFPYAMPRTAAVGRLAADRHRISGRARVGDSPLGEARATDRGGLLPAVVLGDEGGRPGSPGGHQPVWRCESSGSEGARVGRRAITRAELVGKILPALPERYRALVLTAAYTGLRWGECAGLRWAQVDMDARRLVVIETVVEVSGRLTRKPYPKSEAGRRAVPLPQALVTRLRRHAELVPSGADDLVFPDSGGSFLRRSNFRRHVWVPARAAAGVPDSLAFHGLRHCYATWLITEGVPVNVVQVALGHERASMTLDRYTHRPRDYEDRLRDALTDSADDSPTGDDREG